MGESAKPRHTPSTELVKYDARSKELIRRQREEEWNRYEYVGRHRAERAASEQTQQPGKELELYRPERDQPETAPSQPGKELELYRPEATSQPGKELELYRPQSQELEVLSKEVAPEPESVEQPGELHLTFVDQTRDAKSAARSAAEERLTNELNEGNRARRFIKGIWKGNIAREYYRQKYQSEALKDIEASGNINLHELNDDAAVRAKYATLDRFQTDYEETLHAGEKREQTSTELEDKFKELIKQNISGELSNENLIEQRNRLLGEHYGDAHDKGKVTIDNLQAVLDAVRGAMEHGRSLDDVVAGMRITMGESRSGARTEAHYSKVDKTIEKLQGSKIGALVTPETLAVGVSIAASVGKIGSQRAIGAAAMTIVPGIAAGVFAGMRENKAVKDERAQHAREMAVGKAFEEGSKRREQMQETMYEMTSSETLRSSIEHFSSEEELSTQAGIERAITALSSIEARIQVSDLRNIDLISYSDPENVESERLALDLARAHAKVALEKVLTSEMRDALKMGDEDTLRTLIAQRSELFLETHEADITDKDLVFRKLKNRRVVAAAAKGVVTGVALGLVAQETLATIDPSREGLVERMWQHQTNEGAHQTVLSGLASESGIIDKQPHFVPPSSEYNTEVTGEDSSLRVSADHTIQRTDVGRFNLIDGTGKVAVDDLKLNENGSLPQETIDVLREKGMTVTNTSTAVEHSSSEVRAVGIKEYLKNHSAETTKIKRDFWYDNGTSRIDKNELKLDWGGNNGVDARGGFSMDIGSMTGNSSSNGGENINWRTAADEGKLKLFISGSKDTQSQAFEVPVGRDGSIHIAQDSPAAKFFAVENGRTVFHGAYAELAEVGQIESNGTTHIRPLATEVGDNRYATGRISDVMENKTREVRPSYTITTAGYEAASNVSNYTEMAPVIPVASRRPLESLRRRPDLRPDQMIFGGYYSGKSQEALREWANDEDRLRTRYSEKGPDGRTVWKEVDGSVVERSVARERVTIKGYLDKQRAANPTHYQKVEQVAKSMEKMTDNCRVSVNIPAWMEGHSMRHLLDEYIKQTDAKGQPLQDGIFEINILVNRKTGTEADNSVEVIKQFMADYKAANSGQAPRVNYYDVELDPPTNNVGYARKLLTDAVMLRSLERSSQADPLYIESEDADLVHVDPRTVTNLISKLDKYPHLDAARGMQDRDPAFMKDNDYLMMRRRTADLFELLARRKQYRNPSGSNWDSFANRIITGGWNTGYTAEAYAMIDGYESIVAGEDISIGERIGMVRGDGSVPNLETIGTVPTKIQSSPRRFISEIINNRSAYDDFGNEEDNDKIRSDTLNDMMHEINDYSRINNANQHAFADYLDEFYRWTQQATPNGREAEQMMRRILHFLGFEKGDYEIKSKGLHVSDWNNFKNNVSRYRNEYDLVKGADRRLSLRGWDKRQRFARA